MDKSKYCPPKYSHSLVDLASYFGIDENHTNDETGKSSSSQTFSYRLRESIQSTNIHEKSLDAEINKINNLMNNTVSISEMTNSLLTSPKSSRKILLKIPVGKKFTRLRKYTVSNSPDLRMLTRFNHYKITQPQLSFSTGENSSLRQQSIKNETKNTIVFNNQRQSSIEYTNPGKVKIGVKAILRNCGIRQFLGRKSDKTSIRNDGRPRIDRKENI